MTAFCTDAEFDGKPLSHVISDVERSYFCWALNRAGGNKREAARIAGLTYKTFMRKFREMDLKVVYHAG